MTQNSFLRKVRIYAILAQRYRTSYANAVNALVAARLRTIRDDALSTDEMDTKQLECTQMVEREYGEVDTLFKVGG